MGPDVLILLGSKSDLPIAEKATKVLKDLGIPHEVRVASAHRTPQHLEELVRTKGAKVFIGIAGVAAALPGVIAAMTTRPVIGVPVGGAVPFDSLLSIVQMPGGVPVGTFAIGPAGAVNAGLMAASIVGATHPEVREALRKWRERRTRAVLDDPDPRVQRS